MKRGAFLLSTLKSEVMKKVNWSPMPKIVISDLFTAENLVLLKLCKVLDEKKYK